MKKQLLFFAFLLSIIIALSICVCATAISVEVDGIEDITATINSAKSGDIVNFKLVDNIIFDESISISIGITVNIDFNGYGLTYNGTGNGKTNIGGIVIDSFGAVLNLKGSNPMTDHRTYTHYGDDVVPDMTGTGNLICVFSGKLNIENSYLYAKNAYVVYAELVDGANYQIFANQSVLRVDEGAEYSAITFIGGNKYSNSTPKRVLKLSNSVEYGGFYGNDHNFNVTRGSEFTNVLFYDFYLKNDCWYMPDNSAVRQELMHTFDEAMAITGCVFHNYDGTLANIKIRTETGKQNLKLYNCEYNALEVVGKFVGDRIGNACVYIVEIPATCVSTGVMHYYVNGFGEGNKKSNQTIPLNANHTEGMETISYPNGYCSEGIGTSVCTSCGESFETGNVYLPIFVNLGYSLFNIKNSVTLGTKINRNAYYTYISQNPEISLEFGVLVGNANIEVSLENGELAVRNGYAVSMGSGVMDVFEVKVLNIKQDMHDKKFAMEFYIFDGEAIEFSEEELDLLSYNEIEDMLDEIKIAVNELLDTKHKLYYNEDGSFRVLIIADAHMNVSGDATNVQEVKDRIKLLVDRENPNLVIFTGDNTIGSSTEQKLRDNITALVSYIEEKEIPWCHVYGNHDHENALGEEEQQKVYESFEYCVSKSDSRDLTGTGNYVLGVYNQDGSLGSVIYCLDSGTYVSGGGYDYIRDDQIEWYKSSSRLLEEYTGRLVYGMMAFHIPLIENTYAFNNKDNKELVYEYTGNRNEAICSSATDTELLEAIWERGDIKAIVTGHDHINDYMYNYLGVKLCSSPNVSDLTYYNENVQGGRVFDLNLETITDIKTYVSYIIERVSADDFDYFPKDITLENFEGEAPKTGTASLGGGTISGKIELNVVSDKGIDGSSAIEVKRSQTDNSELYIYFDNDSYGKLGENKYLVVWMDFTNIEFRKASVGLLYDGANFPYMTDHDDGTNPPYYYLADGSDQWQTLSHGGDGCFGVKDGGGINGKKGYFAFRTEDFLKSQKGAAMTEETLVTGFYMYLDISSATYADVPFYIDNIMLVEDYTTVK